MRYEIRYESAFVSPLFGHGWRAYSVRVTRYWWRVRLAAFVDRITPPMNISCVGTSFFRVRVRVIQ